MRAVTPLIAAISLIVTLLAAVVTPDPETRNALLGLCILGSFICLTLLLPDFDGRADEDWDSYSWPHN